MKIFSVGLLFVVLVSESFANYWKHGQIDGLKETLNYTVLLNEDFTVFCTVIWKDTEGVDVMVYRSSVEDCFDIKSENVMTKFCGGNKTIVVSEKAFCVQKKTFELNVGPETFSTALLEEALETYLRKGMEKD
ncbi:hypothetical protein QEH56_23705 [Pelagicoccus enzymogenes]|uniref:hypothetical protein n=1 Tax=Pelagicoccus enzymogenes TaxID=2773457 RepID=UPI002810921E|nr:hypothetical protein [Pelagicoccus enzymogenes]MDQ8201192.1 hypothetical protein [Pelagicoccus enzymogenes]